MTNIKYRLYEECKTDLHIGNFNCHIHCDTVAGAGASNPFGTGTEQSFR
jgi:hypothetical protein